MSDNQDGITIRFQAYTGGGLAVNVSVHSAGDVAQAQAYLADLERAYPQLGPLTVLLPEPPDKSVRPYEYRVIGWVRGETTDKDSGQSTPAVYLYAEDLNFALPTVYHEMLHKLPPSINWEKAHSVGSGAPNKATAQRNNRAWNSCDMMVICKPLLDHDKKPIVKDNGFPKLRFSHVVGYSKPDSEKESTPPTQPGSQGGSQTGSQEAGSAPVVTGRPAPKSNIQVQEELSAKSLGVVAAGTPGGPRTWAGPGNCPQCNAPAGKLHSTTCTQGLVAPLGEIEKSAFDDDPLLPWANAYSAGVKLSEAASRLVLEMRDLHKKSRVGMSLTVAAAHSPDGKTIHGRYNFLASLVDKLAVEQGAGKGFHGKVLSFIFGSPIRSESAPGDQAVVLMERLNPGSQRSGPNPKHDPATVEAVNEIIRACMYIESMQDQEEYEYAA